MSVNYYKLWILLMKRKISKSELKNKLGLSSNVIANMGKNMYVNIEVLEKICKELNVTFDDIIEMENEDE